MNNQQKIRLSGSGASHQNGVAGRATKAMVAIAMVMLMHSPLIFPDDILSTEIWPIEIYCFA